MFKLISVILPYLVFIVNANTVLVDVPFTTLPPEDRKNGMVYLYSYDKMPKKTPLPGDPVNPDYYRYDKRK